MSQAPNATLRKRNGLATSAMAITDTVMTSAPTRWSLSARGGTFPRTSLENIRKAPISTLMANVHGTVTPRAAEPPIAASGASKPGCESLLPPGSASPRKNERQNGRPRRVLRTNAYAEKTGFVADLAYKTRQLVEQNAEQSGLGNLTKSVTFDVKTLDALRDSKGSDEGKVFNLVRGLQKEIDDDPNNAPVLQPLKERAERILKDLENRNVTGIAAIDLLGAIAAEKEALIAEAKASGLSAEAFGVMNALREDSALKAAGIDAKEIATQIDQLAARFPNAKVNDDERRRLRASLYLPLLELEQEDSARIVDFIMRVLLP